jgi:hypothetical protein
MNQGDSMRSDTIYKLSLAGFSLLMGLACNAAYSAFNPTPALIPSTSLPVPTLTSAPLISQQVSLVTVPFHETHPGGNFPTYTITSQTPQLTGSDDPRLQAFNQRLNELVTREVDTHRQNFQQLPITPLSNGSFLDVTYTLVSQVGDLWSFKFDFSFYADTAAHPGSYSLTMNYDLAQGREHALDDLFLPNSNYLEIVSNYCTTELSKRSYSDSFFLDGAKPTPENYRSWNITPDGLLVTFEAYQVAPYASGPQTIVVPFHALQAVINPQGPLAQIAR